MNEETLHNFPSFCEEVQTVTAQPDQPARMPTGPVKVKNLYDMIDGRLPERQRLTARPHAAPQQAGGGFANAIKEAFHFLISHP